MDLKELNEQFALTELVTIRKGKGDLTFIDIATPHATASISLNGGQVTSYKPSAQQHDLMFVSKNAYYEAGKAIKGGAPICWPWFAANPTDASLPFHGFVRNRYWQIQSTEILPNSDIRITLNFTSNSETLQYWPYTFELQEIITIGESLRIELITKNTGHMPFTITQAIHTYFSIGDISQLTVSGLENKTYLDKVDHFARKTQNGEIQIDSEVDRIYTEVDSPLLIHDRANDRIILIEHQGSHTAVVWNPWIDISRNSKDLENDDYKRFVCVETANAADDIVTIPPSAEYCLTANYRISSS